jgi:hypothetical protein
MRDKLALFKPPGIDREAFLLWQNVSRISRAAAAFAESGEPASDPVQGRAAGYLSVLQRPAGFALLQELRALYLEARVSIPRQPTCWDALGEGHGFAVFRDHP